MKYVALLLAFLIAGTLSQADTLYLKSGARIDGTIVGQKGDVILLDANGRRVGYRASEVKEVKKNAKTGAFDKTRAQQRAESRDHELSMITGLPREVRKEIVQILRDLQADEPPVVASAKRRLISIGKESNVFPYFEYYLPQLTPFVVPNVVDVLYSLDEQKTLELLTPLTASLHRDVRAMSIRLLGRKANAKNTRLVLRSTLDHEEIVRSAGAEALGGIGDERALPLLVGLLSDPSIYVRSAAEESLRTIVGDPVLGATKPNGAAEWREYLSQHPVTNAYVVNGLEPLVPLGTQFENE